MKITESQLKNATSTFYECEQVDGLVSMRKAIESLGIEVITDPKTITINGVEVPGPERTEPVEGTSYYIADTSQEGCLYTFKWSNDESDKEWLQKGLVYLKKKDAKAVIEAMMKPLTEYMEKKS